MSNIEVLSRTQHVEVEALTQVVEVVQQHIIADPVTFNTEVVTNLIKINVRQAPKAVSVINAGPPGPPGPSSLSSDPAVRAFQEAEKLPFRTVDYIDGLPSTVQYVENPGDQLYEAVITYVNDLPTLVTLTRLSDSAVFTKTITYFDGLVVSILYEEV